MKWTGKKNKAQTDLNLVNSQREGLLHQIPCKNRGPSYLLALQPAANHLYLIVRYKLCEDQRGIWPQSLLCCWIGVLASRESMGVCLRCVICALLNMESNVFSSAPSRYQSPLLLKTWKKFIYCMYFDKGWEWQQLDAQHRYEQHADICTVSLKTCKWLEPEFGFA